MAATASQLWKCAVQITLVARIKDKTDLRVVPVTTGDVDPPTFTQPPLIRANGESLSARLAVSKPSTVFWAVVYANVAGAHRGAFVEFASSSLSTDQILELSDGESDASVLRRLHQLDLDDDHDGPIIGWVALVKMFSEVLGSLSDRGKNLSSVHVPGLQ